MAIPDSVKNKIAKLLALASDKSNEFESESAAAAAQALMIKYNLTQDAVLGATRIEHKEIFEKTDVLSMGKIPDWKLILAGNIGKINGVYVLKQRYKDKRVTTMTMIGRKDDIEIVKTLYDYISSQIEWHVSFRKGYGASYLKSFRVGMCRRIYERMQAARLEAERAFISENSNNPMALVVAKNTLQYSTDRINRIEKFLDENGENIKTFTVFTRIKSAIDDGKQAGDRVILTRPARQLSKAT